MILEESMFLDKTKYDFKRKYLFKQKVFIAASARHIERPIRNGVNVVILINVK